MFAKILPALRGRWRLCAAYLALFLSLTAMPAEAQSTPNVTSNDVTINLIHLLVQQGIITAAQADSLVNQAKQEAAQATAAASPAPVAPPSIHVTYVPEMIREQIKQEAEKDLLKQGKSIPVVGTQLPDWLRRIKISGDFRARYEWNFYDQSNSPNFINFNAINQGSPLDTNPNTNLTLPPFLNTTEERQRMRVRARLGLTDQVNNHVEVGLRLSTGSDGSPVSPNQTEGNSFSNYPVVFDRVYLDYHPLSWAKMVVGRFANPWFRTDLVWYNDLNFDGVMFAAAKEVTPDLKPFFTAGVFPVENSAFDFPTNSETKSASSNKWLYAAQIGTSWLVTPQELVRFGAAYYYYNNIQGSTSSLCDAATSATPCNSDNSRPGFLQQGNTLYAIRNLVSSSTGSTPQYQYFGLASPFHIIDFTGRLDIDMVDSIHLILDSEVALNTAFNASKTSALSPVNNFDDDGNFASGNLAYLARVTIGHPVISEAFDWSAFAEYKYLEADSVLDAFTDPDFHAAGTSTGTIGGTNAKGVVLGASVGLSHNVWFTTKFDTSTEITGQPFSVDTLQTDINARF